MIAALPFLAWPADRGLLSILIYHRVLERADPMRPGEIDAETFDAHMRLLAAHCAVLPLCAAAAALKAGRLPRRACAVTFDDGYADNLHVALPILEHYGIPSTVFVATDFLDGGRMFNDTVIEIFASAEGRMLDLRDIGLGLHALDDLAARLRGVERLLDELRYRPPEERAGLLEQIIELADCRRSLPGDLMLTSGEVAELAGRGVEIGGHTMAHPVLTSVDADEAMRQIQGGRGRLESLTGRPVRCFAYPNGRPQRDYRAEHVGLLEGLGFEAAVTTAYGVANPHTDPLQLPRFTSWGRHPAMFAARLTRNARLRAPSATCPRAAPMPPR